MTIENFDLRPDPVGPPSMPEGIAEGAYTWNQAHLSIAQSQAGAWFHAKMTAREIARPRGIEALLSQVLPNDTEGTIGNEFVLDPSQRRDLVRDPARDRRLDLEHSPEGGRLRAMLGELGINMSSLDDGQMVGVWVSAFGTRFLQACALHESGTGERYYYWYTTVLASNRPWPTTEEGDFARLIVVPRLLQTIAYLAETPFPSTPYFSMERAELLKGDGIRLPDAIAVERTFPQVMVKDEDTTVNLAGASIAVESGYVIPCDLNEAELSRAISIASDAGIHQQTMIEDGYRNHSKSETLEFQLHLFSGAGTGQNHQRWIAALALHDLISQATGLRNLATQDESVEDEVDHALLTQAVGLPFVWAVNNEVFRRLIPQKRYDEAVELLEIAVAYDEGIESVNAKSNQAVVEYERGNVDQAIPLFESLLDLEDPYVEEEPRYYLGVIAMERGDLTTAHRHLKWIIDRRVRHSNYMKKARAKLAELSGEGDDTVVPLHRKQESGTPFEARCQILGEFWFGHRDDEAFEEYFEYNDVGLPLAYSISEGLATPTEAGMNYVNESFMLLLEALGFDDDGFESLDELLDSED